MPMTEGNIAYDLTVRKVKKQADTGVHTGNGRSSRHVVSSKTVRLNKLSKSKRASAPLPMVRAFRSLNAHQWKVVMAAGAAFVALAAFFLVTINYQVKENELAAAIAQRQSELRILQNDYDSLMVKYDAKMSDAAIEEYAENVLGMQKREKFQIEWIEVGSENDFENENVQKNNVIDWITSYFD